MALLLQGDTEGPLPGLGGMPHPAPSLSNWGNRGPEQEGTSPSSHCRLDGGLAAPSSVPTVCFSLRHLLLDLEARGTLKELMFLGKEGWGLSWLELERKALGPARVASVWPWPWSH